MQSHAESLMFHIYNFISGTIMNMYYEQYVYSNNARFGSKTKQGPACPPSNISSVIQRDGQTGKKCSLECDRLKYPYKSLSHPVYNSSEQVFNYFTF